MNQKKSSKEVLPQHVAIVMDGNGRWAERQGLPRTHGHQAGVLVLKEIIKACLERRIAVLSVWAFGRENWARPPAEVDFLMQLFLESLENESGALHEAGIRVRFTGERMSLPDTLCVQMDRVQDITAINDKLTLNIVFNYSGKWDIVQAVKSFTQNVIDGHSELTDLSEEYFETYLATHGLPDPELFIRTSGEQRLSNFFLWSLAYSEIYFSSVCWPDFNVYEFDQALSWFAARERRFGKTSQQLLEA